MQHKKTRITPKHYGRSPLVGVTGVCLVADLRRIVSAARKLPAEVAPPARVWRSLRVQLEREGILSRAAKSKLDEHTRLPMFSN